MSIKDDEKKLFAHIYTRHMGDLSGGQMIRKKIPGSGTLYNFENGPALKELIRERLDDSMADEAKICFDFATKTFQELMDVKLTS
jgi:heme oxygenase